jgi:hypothetical protein
VIVEDNQQTEDTLILFVKLAKKQRFVPVVVKQVVIYIKIKGI